MIDLEIRPARAEELSAAAERIASWNRAPATRCLHLGDRPAVVLAEMTSYTSEPAVVIAADAGQDVVGLLGADYLADERRAWLWGPYAPESEFDAVCRRLLYELLALLPEDLAIADSFLEEDNRRGRDALAACGFEERGRAFIYTADRALPEPACTTPSIPVEARHADTLATLHESAFDAPYRSTADLLAGGERDRTWVTVDGDRVTGYVNAGPADGDDEGYIHFLAVAPEHRRRGIGRQLLNTAVRWLLLDAGFAQVGLTVNEDRTNARALYSSAGFELKHTGVSARLRLGASPSVSHAESARLT